MKASPETYYSSNPQEEIIFRDYLAIERTRLANERTLLSYIRTSLYLLLGAIAFFQLEGLDKLKWLAYPSLILSAVSLVVGVWKFFRLNRKLAYTTTTQKNAAGQKTSGQDT